MYQDLLNRNKQIAIIGLGYVGLPLATQFAKCFDVIGFDVDASRIQDLKSNLDITGEVSKETIAANPIQFTSDEAKLAEADFFVVTVSTPVDEFKVPDLSYLVSASQIIGKYIKPGNYVVYESTVYPGCTEEDCIPVIEKSSGLEAGKDFLYGYSPERIVPGDKTRTIDKIVKVTSGNNQEALNTISDVYAKVLNAGIYKAPSIKVAEAAKVVENTQRDLNISLMNELAMLFDKMDIDTREVIDAAATKWNFQKFYPGLVGGHCIGVDPYYLLYKSKQKGYDPQVILSGRRINDQMPSFVAKKAIQLLIQNGKNPKDCSVLVMGITFKENISDIRNSKVVDLIKELKDFSLKVDVVDPYALKEEVKDIYDITLSEEPGNNYDAIILAVAHDTYKTISIDYLKSISNINPVLFDLKGLFEKIEDKGITHWRL